MFWESLSRIRTLISTFSFFKSLYHFPYFIGKKNILYTSSQKDASKLSLEFLHHDPSVLADNLYFHHSFPAAWLILSGMWQKLHLCTFLCKVISGYQFKAWGTEASYNFTGNSPTIYVHPDESGNSKLSLWHSVRTEVFCSNWSIANLCLFQFHLSDRNKNANQTFTITFSRHGIYKEISIRGS